MLNHIYKTVNRNHIYTDFIENYMPVESTFFHCISTGHYWRNSYITELSLLFEDEDHNWILEQWQAEEEKDEYDLLTAFIEKISSFKHIIGYNSTSFHLPYLENKAKAYALLFPLIGKMHTDLLKIVKPTGVHLHISTKLNDLRIFFNMYDDYSDIECIAATTSLFQYENLLNGAFDIQLVERINDELFFSCKSNLELPTSFRISTDDFYLIAENQGLKIKTKLINNQLKLFYPNYSDYYYIPDEDMVIHKSLGDTISKNRRIKATPENCFTYIPYTEQLGNNTLALKKYLVSLFKNYMIQK